MLDDFEAIASDETRLNEVAKTLKVRYGDAR
jgi:hypothetical protein